MQPQAHQIVSAQISQWHLRPNQLIDGLLNGLQPSQLGVPLTTNTAPSFLSSNQSPMRSSSSFMLSTQNGTQTNSTNVVQKLSSLSGRDNGQQAVINASLSTTTPTTSTTLTKNVRPERQCVSRWTGESKTNNDALASTVRGSQLGCGQDSNMKLVGKVTPKGDAPFVSNAYQGGSGYQSSPAQPLARSTPSHNSNNTVGLPIYTEKENQCSQTLPITNQDDSGQVYTLENRLNAQARAIGSLDDQEDDKDSKHLDSIKPVLSVEQNDNGIILSWDITNREYESKVVKYELYVMSVATEAGGLADWETLGIVDALALPMACTMTQFVPGASYYFAVRAITENGHCELFSDPCSITVNGSQ